MGFYSQNKYNVTGNYSDGLSLDISNSWAGSCPSGFTTYDSASYSSLYYGYTAIYEGRFYSPNTKTLFVNSLTGLIDYQFRTSVTGTVFSSWSSITTCNKNTAIIFSTTYWDVRFAWKSPEYSDLDILYFSVNDSGYIPHAEENFGSIKSIIKNNKHRVFRRIYIKRRTSSDYESSWNLINNKYITSFGSIKNSIDDLKINFYQTNGFNFTCNNNDGFFSAPTYSKSFFYGYLPIYRSKIKVDAGYYDKDDTEYPTSATLFVGLIGPDYTYDEDNKITFQVKHISSVFQEFYANQIPGVTNTFTVSQIFEKIKNYQDSAGTYIFQKYITSSGWHIQSTTSYYNFQTDTALQSMNLWTFMQKLAAAENKLMYISRDGDFYFESKSVTSNIPTYHFSGVGDYDKSYGNNILSSVKINDENINKIYNRIRIKYKSGDTTTSYYIRQQIWNWGDSSSSFIWGVRTYDYTNEYIPTATVAADIATDIYNQYFEPKKEISFSAKFCPHLNLKDVVSFTYLASLRSGLYKWDLFNWGDGIYGTRFGFNIDIDDEIYKISSIEHDLNNFKTNLVLREL